MWVDRHRCVITAALLLASVCIATAGVAEPIGPELEKRLAKDGIDKTNLYIASHAPTLSALHHQTRLCDIQAVSVAIRLSRGRKSKVVDAHTDALRGAVGDCTGFVLSLLAAPEVAKVCASSSSWTIMQSARELRRRIANLEADELLMSTSNGRACRDAYRHEFHHTRVGLRAKPR